MESIEYKGITFYRATKLDINGNPRIIVHFLDFLKPEESRLNHLEKYELARKRAKKCGFRVYNAKDFGGGFIIQGDYQVISKLSWICEQIAKN